MKEFAIKSSNAILSVSEKNFHPVQLHIRDGRVEKVLEHLTKTDLPTIDVGKSFLMPGIVDTHAHINEPGRTEWEGFQTATRAAAAGGITTVVDMPLNSIPATTTLKALEIKKQSAAGQCLINVGFWGGVVPGNSKELEPMIKAGARGFKAFTIDSGVPEFPMSTREDLLAGMKVLAKHKIPLLVHAELESALEKPTSPNISYTSYLESRPQKWEVDAIQMMIELVRETECPVHVVHLSAASALSDLRAARKEGLPITVETCPHYLTFSAEDIPDKATHFKCAPPIRENSNREALWEGLLEGDIDMIVSDHSPCTPKLKERESGNFDKAWGGISGIQFSFPAIWTEMRKREIPLTYLVRWMIDAPARLARLERGTLMPGAVADIVVWDPDKAFTVKEGEIRHRHPVTPYLQKKLYGKIQKTFVAGEIVYDEDKR